MTTTVSTKYQIVIPKAVRKQLDIRPGQKMLVRATKDGQVSIKKDSRTDVEAIIKKYAGSIKTKDTAWGQAGISADEWLRRERDSWDG